MIDVIGEFDLLTVLGWQRVIKREKLCWKMSKDKLVCDSRTVAVVLLIVNVIVTEVFAYDLKRPQFYL